MTFAGWRSGVGPVAGLERLKDEILSDLDAEESRLTGNPPRTEDARASKCWDDAVEARDETLIAEFDTLQWDVAGLAGRFAIPLPGVD